jgi:Uma2 family endonuclease
VAVEVHHGGVDTILGRGPREPLTEVDVRSWPLGIGAVRLREGLAFVAAKHASGFTLDDIDAIPEDGRRYELLDGVVVVSPAPNRPHQRAVLKLAAILLAAERPPTQTLVAPYDVDLTIARRMQPDVLVLTAPDERVPLLVVEVGSPSTRRYDREEKRRAYAEAGIASYWLVEVAAPFPVRFRPADLLD